MNQVQPLIEVIGVTARFGNLAAIQNVVLHVTQGEILAVIGPNGAGKTTLLNAISGALTNWSGEIRFRGASLKGLKPHEIGRLGISRTFQIAQPFLGMTMLENVTAGAIYGTPGPRPSLRAARHKAMEILELLELAPIADVPAEQLNMPSIKRLELARALSMNPRLLLLDEFLAGLNPTEVDHMIDRIRKVRESGITVLMIEHIMHVVVRLCDRIVVLHHGEKILEGSPEAVLHDRRVISAYLGARFDRRSEDGIRDDGE